MTADGQQMSAVDEAASAASSPPAASMAKEEHLGDAHGERVHSMPSKTEQRLLERIAEEIQETEAVIAAHTRKVDALRRARSTLVELMRSVACDGMESSAWLTFVRGTGAAQVLLLWAPWRRRWTREWPPVARQGLTTPAMHRQQPRPDPTRTFLSTWAPRTCVSGAAWCLPPRTSLLALPSSHPSPFLRQSCHIPAVVSSVPRSRA